MIGALIALLAAGAPGDEGFRAPEGFEVSLFAGDDLAHDIYALTIDSHGRVVVAGRGYIRTLHDRDGDGRADDATLFADWPRTGARGLYFDGDDLLCSGDRGLHRIEDRDGDGKADASRRLLPSENDGDHAANGILKGPDGWLYWICGNDAEIGRKHVTLPGSPITDVNCGAVVRIAPDGSASEVIAHGFRNPYDLAFNAHGTLFTYDADGERVHYLPFYGPTRIFDIAHGMHHGWVLRGWVHAWSRPGWFTDNVERLAVIGRGSPTGVLVYRHRAFPERYREGLFAICWSFGRIYFFPLERRGSTWSTRTETFLEPIGATGFAPVDMAVDPRGDIFVAIGGRGTRGSVFRVRYVGELPDAETSVPADALRAVLAADQPLSSWSRARWVPAARTIGRDAFERAALDASRPCLERLRAVEILVELFDGVGVDLARRISSGGTASGGTASGGDPEVTARAVWAVSCGDASASSRSTLSTSARSFLSAMTHEDDARIARAAWEALGGLPPGDVDVDPSPDWLGGFAHDDRRVRAATVVAARGALRQRFGSDVPPVGKLDAPRHIVGALLVRGPSTDATHFDACLRAFTSTRDRVARLAAVRLVQLGLGDIALVQDRARVTDGYTGRSTGGVDVETRRRVARGLAAALPSLDRALDQELARALAMLEVDVDGLLARMANLWTLTSPVEDDIHFLLAAARIPGERPPGFTRACAAALARLQEKMDAGRKEPSRFWPRTVGDAFDDLRARDPRLVSTLIAHPKFGLPGHTLFAERLRGDERHAVVRRLIVAASRGDNGAAWTSELVRLAGDLPDGEGLDALRDQWTDPVLRDAIALVLARKPRPVDRERLVEALASRQGAVIERAARALARLEGEARPDELAGALLSLRDLCSLRAEERPRRALADLLARWSGESFEVKETKDGDLLAAYRSWFDWFERRYPEEAETIGRVVDGGVAAWIERAGRIDWEAGDAERGVRVYRERQCAGCHDGSRRLGPDLRGVAARLSPRDLLISIVDPSRDISPAHVAREVITRRGDVHRGAMIYESPATTMLQTSADTTVRLAAGDIVETRPSRISFMPEGLLTGLPDTAVADLHAYLRTRK